jgi:hypothetical protein
MTRFIPLMLLLASCSSAEPHSKTDNCGAWDDMRRGLVACEPGDQCGYDVGDMHEVCDCGHDVHLFWCKAVP